MTLASVQNAFFAYLLDRPSTIKGDIQGDIDVYHYAYRAQLRDCLKDTFDKTWAWLGDERFDAAALAHITANPSHTWTLNDYGEGFDDTLARLYPDDPEIRDLAWLEWRLRRAFDGPDAQAIEAERLATVDWDSAVIQFAPTLVLGQVSSNAAAIWSALNDQQSPPQAVRLEQPASIRVWRQGLSPKFRSIEPIEEQALHAAMEGTDFAGICAMLTASHGSSQGITEAGRLLGLWLQDGLIEDISDYPSEVAPISFGPVKSCL